MLKTILLLLTGIASTLLACGQEFYVNAKIGDDENEGSKVSPLKTLGEASKRVNVDVEGQSATIILAEGVYVLAESVVFSSRRFAKDSRLTIRSEVLPDEADWNPQKMPIITSVIAGMPVSKDGEESKGIDIETSHVTIEGLRFTGTPAYYYIQGSEARRYYPVWRGGKNMEDLVVSQCLFAGNVDVSPIRVAVIANGHGLVVEHCVFYNCQNPVVFWEAVGDTSHGNIMRYCLVYGANYSGVWTTAQTGDDLEFHHNIIANSHTTWVRDYNSVHHYQIHDCIFTNNDKLAGNGIDKPISKDFISMENVELSGTVEIEKDQSKRNYLQLKEGSFGSALQAGLFKK